MSNLNQRVTIEEGLNSNSRKILLCYAQKHTQPYAIVCSSFFLATRIMLEARQSFFKLGSKTINYKLSLLWEAISSQRACSDKFL